MTSLAMNIFFLLMVTYFANHGIEGKFNFSELGKNKKLEHVVDTKADDPIVHAVHENKEVTMNMDKDPEFFYYGSNDQINDFLYDAVAQFNPMLAQYINNTQCALIGIDAKCFLLSYAEMIGETWNTTFADIQKMQFWIDTFLEPLKLTVPAAKFFCFSAPAILNAATFQIGKTTTEEVYQFIDRARSGCVITTSTTSPATTTVSTTTTTTTTAAP